MVHGLHSHSNAIFSILLYVIRLVIGQFQSHSSEIYYTPFYVILITVDRFHSLCNAKWSTVFYRHFYSEIKEKLTYNYNATNAAFYKSGLSTEFYIHRTVHHYT